MIGANNLLNGQPAEQVLAGIRACLLRIRNKTPQAKIILMGVLPCRNPATHPNRVEVVKVNEGLKKLAEEAKCDFLDIGGKFLDAQGNIPKNIMDDAVHPTPAGYKIWSDALAPLLAAESRVSVLYPLDIPKGEHRVSWSAASFP